MSCDPGLWPNDLGRPRIPDIPGSPRARCHGSAGNLRLAQPAGHLPLRFSNPAPQLSKGSTIASCPRGAEPKDSSGRNHSPQSELAHIVARVRARGGRDAGGSGGPDVLRALVSAGTKDASASWHSRRRSARQGRPQRGYRLPEPKAQHEQLGRMRGPVPKFRCPFSE